MHRSASNEATLVSEIPNIIDQKNVIIAPERGKTPFSIFSDEFCEEQQFPHLFLKRKFGFNPPRNIPICPSRYLNQRLLNFNQYFALHADYIL